MSGINLNIGGWMDEGDLVWLYETAQKMDNIVEIGCWEGRSSFALLSGCKGPVYCIDTFDGGKLRETDLKKAKTHDIYKIFLDNVGHFPNLRVAKMKSEEAVISFDSKSIDMVFIDGDHEYPGISFDLKAWLPQTKILISGHDAHYSPIQNALKEILVNYETTQNNIWFKYLK